MHYNKDVKRMYNVAQNIQRKTLSQLLSLKNREGNTLLHCAVLNQARNLVKYLLVLYPFMNTDINIRNNENKTPMELAQGTSMEDLFLSASKH